RGPCAPLRGLSRGGGLRAGKCVRSRPPPRATRRRGVMAELPVDLALTEGRVPDRVPEGVPELHEVDCPPELRERIETLMGRYPDRRSASIPSLWAVQRSHGWCTPERLGLAAAVLAV